jgi:hypothetical protein
MDNLLPNGFEVLNTPAISHRPRKGIVETMEINEVIVYGVADNGSDFVPHAVC